MKFLIILITVFAGTAFAENTGTVEFQGKLTHSRYPKLLGRTCTIHVQRDPKSSDEYRQFFVELKIEGVSPILHRRKAPKKDMFLFRKTAPNTYHAQGGKYRHEMSQQLFVTMDASETKVLKWVYIDGTVEWFGKTYICE